MGLKKIAAEDFNTNIFRDLDRGWMLLTAGDRQEKFNPMTVSWGFMGTFWFKPMVIVGVRPQRYTFGLMTEYDTFSLCAFPPEYHPALSFCGSHSGRDGDKTVPAGLTPIAGDRIAAPVFAEAELILECRKTYAAPLDGKSFLNKALINECYRDRDFHQLFFGEVLEIRGVDKYCQKG
ncbi:MAG: flavin reductase [Victivallales bacterium]|nr:flavin reductase [Victivallales bacterium]